MTSGLRRALLALAAISIAVLGYVAGRGLLPAPPTSTGTTDSAAVAPPAPYAEAEPPVSDSLLEEPPAFEPPAREPRRQLRQGQERRRERLREALRPERARSGAATLPLARAIAEHSSGVWVEGQGEVRRTMRDDLRGRQHQRIVLELADGGTLLIAHNTQLGGRAPAEMGATIRFRGRYEWNQRGGVVHWTHRDPRGGNGGWLEVDGRRYE